MNSTIEVYYRLRAEVDRQTAALESVHSDWMACKKGCCGCCMDLTVWPVEFYSIVEEIKQLEWDKPQFNDDAACGFLKDGLCVIYPFRPIICRTHGLPLVYWHEETDPPGYGVMFCEKNFRDADEIEFGPDSTLNMDKVNEKLARLNVAFVEEKKDLSLESDTRIEMRKLLDYL